ncbi:MAG: cytochrome c [Acidobacteria bacterium]|nr:cytochrome c [Acidobacteriota bacterium]
MTKNRIKVLLAAVFAVFAVVVISIGSPAQAGGVVQETTADVYRAKCQACHTAKAEKFYDPSKSIEDQKNIILNGKKTEKPPSMPAFATKTPAMTPEQAQALAEYMKSLRTAPPAE